MTKPSHPPKLMLLGSGELGKEFAICAQRLGCTVVAVDNYAEAPAMQVADEAVVMDMLDGKALKKAVRKHRPDHVVPEVEAIRTEALLELEASGVDVIPANAASNHEPRRHPIVGRRRAWTAHRSVRLRLFGGRIDQLSHRASDSPV